MINNSLVNYSTSKSFLCYIFNNKILGKQIYEFSGQTLLRVKNLTDFGLPKNINRVRLAYNWNYGLDLKYYIWSEDFYWKIDVKQMKAELDYPRPIAENWKNISSSILAAFSWNKRKK